MVFVIVGFAYTVSLTIHTVDYYVMKKKYTDLNGQFNSLQTSIRSLKDSEMEFKRLFSLGTKKRVLDAAQKELNEEGSINIEELKLQISESLASVSEIKSYLAKELDIKRSMPEGWPVEATISSNFGMRNHPRTGQKTFHSGIDLFAPRDAPVRATADGVVSFSSWSKGSGNVVVIEHGHDFTTVYAHNNRNSVKTGQTVKRGEVIALLGATGNATGPHLHYEVWKNGQYMNPSKFIGEPTRRK
jgi:murein DD-endopeptidase MepM/ murein hydrolase activator NlpD